MVCARGPSKRRKKHAGSRHLRFWHGCDRGWSSRLILEAGVDGLSDICIPFKVFTGRYPFGELRTPVVITAIVNDKRPARPQETQKLGLTDQVWDMTLRCWGKDPVNRPTVMEVVGFLREWSVFSLCMN